jgi:hypothetical protein
LFRVLAVVVLGVDDNEQGPEKRLHHVELGVDLHAALALLDQVARRSFFTRFEPGGRFAKAGFGFSAGRFVEGHEAVDN